MKDFSERVIKVVKKIPRGKTLSYVEVAQRAGSPRAYRAVGTILRTYEVKVFWEVPCHRVIRSDGSPGGYRWGSKKKHELLKKENALV